MGRKDAARRAEPSRKQSPGMEALPDRALLTSVITSVYLPQAWSEFVSQFKKIEQNSRATPAEYTALRDDARSISEATTRATVGPQTAAEAANAATLLIDRALLDGWMGQAAWADVGAKLTNNLTLLGASPPLIAKTFGDMQAAADSARVNSDEFQNFTAEFNQVRSDENYVGASAYGYPDPELYYTQNLGGFFRGWALNRTADRQQLQTDVASVTSAASAADAGAVRRDVSLLEKLGGRLSSLTGSTFFGTYVTAFGPGTPALTEPSVVKSELQGALGASATRSWAAQVTRLIADAPAFYAGAGSSEANVATIAADVQAVVNDGVSSPPNPFRITVAPNGGGRSA